MIDELLNRLGREEETLRYLVDYLSKLEGRPVKAEIPFWFEIDDPCCKVTLFGDITLATDLTRFAEETYEKYFKGMNEEFKEFVESLIHSMESAKEELLRLIVRRAKKVRRGIKSHDLHWVIEEMLFAHWFEVIDSMIYKNID